MEGKEGGSKHTYKHKDEQDNKRKKGEAKEMKKGRP
jgi:hypothetical protein